MIKKNATSEQLAYQETDSLALCSYRTEGKDGHLNVLFQSSNCLLQENKKKTRVLPRPQTNSSPSSMDLPAIYHRHESGKKAKYSQWVKVEHGVLTPLVFSTTGEMARECSTYYRRLADMISITTPS